MADEAAIEGLLARLAELGVDRSRTLRHVPVFTCETHEAEVAPLWPLAEVALVKNLFLKDKASGQLWVCCLPADSKTDLKALAKQLGSKNVRFADEDVLVATMGVAKGGVTPLALVNDTERKVRIAIDRSLAESPKPLGVHPLVNSMTTLIMPEQLRQFLQTLGREWFVLDA